MLTLRPGLEKLLKTLTSKSLMRRRQEHATFSNQRIQQRLHRPKSEGSQRNDFMTYILRHNDEKGMDVLEIEQTMRVLVVAGSETTATALSGIVRNLLQNPAILRKASAEIRKTFQHITEINARGVGRLPYLGALIEEGLRMCPPVPLGMPRIIPEGGAIVSGQWLEPGVRLAYREE